MNSQYRKIKGGRDGVRHPFLLEQNTTSKVDRMPGQTIYRRRASKAAATELEREWAVILAGRDGTGLNSLTPRVTGDDRPKQFCPITGDLTLVEEAQRRVALELAKERTLFLQISSGRLPWGSTLRCIRLFTIYKAGRNWSVCYERRNVGCMSRRVGDFSSVVFTIGIRIEFSQANCGREIKNRECSPWTA